MAVIKKNTVSLKALTATALSLPGMMAQPAFAAEGDEVDFQYSHYQEGARNISGLTYNFDGTQSVATVKSFQPIEVEGLHGSAKISLSDRVKFAFNYTQDTWGGATPLSTAPAVSGSNNFQTDPNDSTIVTGATPYATPGTLLFLDKNLKPLLGVSTLNFDPITNQEIYKFSKNNQLTHVMSYASPETRKQGDFKLSYDWDNASASIGGGISIEDDYESRFGNLGGRFDFNQKQTTLNIDLSYTNSDTKAVLDHDSYTISRFSRRQIIDKNEDTNARIVQGNRQDWATSLGLTQVLNKDAVVGADFSYTRSTGYLDNPYKAVAIAFIKEDQQNSFYTLPEDGYLTHLVNYYEQRPSVRNLLSLGGRYIQYINPLNAALHFNYHFAADDWGIQAHTFEADWVQPISNGWTITPKIRYYSQDAADFYAPWLYSTQDDGSVTANGQHGRDFDARTLRDPSNPNKDFSRYFSSDQRLSGFGALSGGLTVTKQFSKGLTLETGFEYYTHQGSLKIGGGGEGSFADFDYWLANAALKVNLDSLSSSGGGHSGHGEAGNHHHGAVEPAGVMFAHMLPKAGDFMVGYRYMWNSQSGNMFNGTEAVNNASVVGGGCTEPNSYGCFLTPDSMSMSMHMLDLMYAPTDWLTLMLMPQFVDMHMEMRPVLSSTIGTVIGDSHSLNGHYTHHIQNAHETGGIGDLGMYALFKVVDNDRHHLHATAGFSAPTGDVNIQLRRNHAIDGGFIDYGMQLGSGTWDFKPSITYTGHLDEFSWGAQANGTVRMEGKNESGYHLGDMFQGTAWGGYNLTSWLTASVRGIYTVQGSIKGQFTGSEGGQFSQPNGKFQGADGLTSIYKYSPNDYPANYGGRFWDVGFGLTAMVPGDGLLGGNRISVEWVQPVHTDYNGYQLDRDGALNATWNVAF